MTGPVVPASTVLGAVEALFGAGTSVAPMSGATLLRYLPKMSDPWTNGLHLDEEPDVAGLGEALDTWEAFERPGRVRWAVAPGDGAAPQVRDVVAGRTREGAPADLLVASRPIFHGALMPRAIAEASAPDDVAITWIGTDIRDWAGFEILARWIDMDEDPAVWRWRATRVRNLVQGSRGTASLARIPAAPVGASLLLRAPDHRPDADPVVACVVHAAHRRRGVAAGLIGDVARAHSGPITVLGDAAGHLAAAAKALGLAYVADLVEVGPRPDPEAIARRKA